MSRDSQRNPSQPHCIMINFLGPNGKIVLIRFVHVHKKYKTRVGDRQRKSGYCGILAQKVSVRTRALIMLLYQI